MEESCMRIEFCAPLGTGKSTVAKALADCYGWAFVEEASTDHPFLPDFYKDPKKYGFEKDAYFAIAYAHNVKRLAGQNAVFDAGNLLSQSYSALTALKPEEKAAMDALYAQSDALPKPDLLIYLDYPAEKIMERIAGRGREMEKDVPESFVRNLQNEILRHLEKTTVPVLRLNMEDFDLVKNPDDVRKIARLVSENLRKPAIPTKKPAP
jgi:deoxyadenosine/deoxycytidine kinase